VAVVVRIGVVNAVAAGAPRSDSYDAVVIGSGLGGLSSAALLARAGLGVLVCEQAEAAGGYAHAFRRGPYTIDPAVHVFPQGGTGEMPTALFEFLGVDDQLEMLPVEHYYRAFYPDLSFIAPRGIEQFSAAMGELFPKEAGAIEGFLRLGERIQRQAHTLPPNLNMADMAQAAKNAPDLFEHLRSTTAEVLDQHFEDPMLKSALGIVWPYLGVPPSNLSALIYWTLMTMFLESGYYSKGSFERMVQAFVTAIERHGGEVVLGAPATRIAVEEGRVSGVEIAGEKLVRAPLVVANSDARALFVDMLDEDALPSRFMNRIKRMRPSLSAVVVMLATNLDLEAAGADHEIFRPLHDDHERSYADVLDGRPGGMWASVPTLIDDSLAPPGEHLLIITSLAPYDIGRPWKSELEPYADAMIEAHEHAFPGLSESITFRETASPLTLERYVRNHQGAIYGWENNPAQSGGRRAPHQTPIEGLFLAGHWTQPGSSSLRCVVSGMHAADLALRFAGRPFEFEHPHYPPV
jgi:phytoene desaturase